MTSSPLERGLAAWVTWLVARRRWLFVFGSCVALIGGVRTALTYAGLRSELEELLPETAPSVRALSEVRARIAGIRHLGVVVDTGGPEQLAAAQRFLDDLAQRLRSYPASLVGAVRVDVRQEREFATTYALQLMELSDVEKLRAAVEARRDYEVDRALGTDLLDEPDVEPPPSVPLDELRAKYHAKFGSSQRFPGDRLVSANGDTAVLLVQASSHATGYGADSELLRRVQADIRALGFPNAYAPELRVGYAGDVATRVEEMEGLAADLRLSGALVLLLVFGVLVLYFRSLRALPILLVPLAVGVLGTFALVALPPLSIRHLNSNTAFLGSIIIGNGINTGIILLARCREERHAGFGLQEAVTRGVQGTFVATLAAALAASAAYGSLVLTDFRGFSQFGFIGGIGMLVCWAAMQLLMPGLIVSCGIEPTPRARWSPKFGVTAWRSLLRPVPVLAFTLLASALASAALFVRSSDWIEHDFSKLRRRDSWEHGERYWGSRMDRTLQTYLTPTVVMAKDTAQAQLIEQRLLDLKEQGRAGGLIASVRSINGLLSPDRFRAVVEAQKIKAALTPRISAQLPPEVQRELTRVLSPQSLKPLEVSDLPEVLVTGLRERDGQTGRNILVFPKLSPDTWDARKIETFAEDLREAASVGAEPAAIAGSLLLSNDIAHAMRRDGFKATTLSLVIVLVVLWFAFRRNVAASLRRTLGLSAAAMVSLFVGVLLMLGGMAISGGKLNFSNFVALPITFGVAADYSINVLMRYRSSAVEARSQLALGATGGAVALCSATTVIGFGSLLVAQNRALFSFGLLAVLGELACLFTAVLALPAALALYWERRGAR